MANYLDLESAIMDAEGAVAVFDILQSHLTGSTAAGFQALGLTFREDICVTALSPQEQRALDHAGLELCSAIREVSRVFYAALKERRL